MKPRAYVASFHDKKGQRVLGVASSRKGAEASCEEFAGEPIIWTEYATGVLRGTVSQSRNYFTVLDYDLRR